MSIPMHMLGNLKTSPGGASASLNAVAASLRLRRKRPADLTTAANGSDAPALKSATPALQRAPWKNPFSPPTRRKHRPSDADDSESGAETQSPLLRSMVSAPIDGGPLPPARAMHRDESVPDGISLDTISLDAAPHVAIRYGDTIRLFARSKYVVGGGADTGGYIGTFQAGRRFLASKNPPKQGELACLPPVLSSGALMYRPSSFTVVSTCGIAIGVPVSYGDVVVLVDERGRVWNNKIGTGPTTLNGYFGPREQNTPGEMYLSFYQLRDDDGDGDGSSSDSDSDEDGPLRAGGGRGGSDLRFLSLSSLARSTKTMAETTFGKPTQMEMDVATKAMRTMGRVVYYGDSNVIIDVADSNRLRSKFNRVVTHYRKSDEVAVRGGYLRCDGRGKAITFELHGLPLTTVESIDVCNQLDDHDHEDHDDMEDLELEPHLDLDGDLDVNGEGDDGEKSNSDLNRLNEGDEQQQHEGGGGAGERRRRRASPTLCVSLPAGGSVALGHALDLKNVQPTSVVSLQFSDGGQLKIPCSRFVEAEGEPFYRVVMGGQRPLRLQLHAAKASRSRRTVSLKKTLRENYKELAKLYGGVVVVSSVVAFVLSKLLRLTISLPAMYLGAVTVFAVFLVELFVPGMVFKAPDSAGTMRSTSSSSGNSDGSDPSDYLGDWKLSILSLEASKTERIECSSPRATLTRKRSTLAMKIPKCFLLAENGNLAKATERYDATLLWRKENRADEILSIPQTHFSTIKQYYHQFLHKTDKLGHPMYFEKIGSINMKQLQKLGITQDDLFRHYLFTMEFTLKYAANQLCSCSACAASETQKLFIVLDAKGIGMKDISGDGSEFIRRCTAIMQRHYPQKSFKIFFVNVPSWFGMAWKGIKPLLNETTRAKTNILSESETADGLLAHIDAANLPVEYGGTCACVGGCEENSAYQRLQKALVESVISCRPFAPEDVIGRGQNGRSGGGGERPSFSDGGMDSEAEAGRAYRDSTTSSNGMTDGSSATVGMPSCGGDDETQLAVGLFREEVLRAGYLLKRPMKHNHFTPIWNKRFFILHPDSLRFGKAPRSEMYQIVQLTSATTVRKTQKGSTTFELVTPLMAKNGHSLVLYASTATALNKWVDAIQHAIDTLAGKPIMAPAAPAGASAGIHVNGFANGHLPRTDADGSSLQEPIVSGLNGEKARVSE